MSAKREGTQDIITILSWWLTLPLNPDAQTSPYSGTCGTVTRSTSTGKSLSRISGRGECRLGTQVPSGSFCCEDSAVFTLPRVVSTQLLSIS